MSQKTLFSYFGKSPAPSTPKSVKDSPASSSPKCDSSSKKQVEKSTPKSTKPTSKSPPQTKARSNGHVDGNHSHTPKSEKKPARKRIIETLDSEDESPSKKKPEGYIIDSEDSGDEYKPDESHDTEDEELSEASEDEPTTASEDGSPVKAPQKRKRGVGNSKPNKKINLSQTFKTPGKTPSKELSKKPPLTPSTPAAGSSISGEPNSTLDNESRNWTHLSCEFLKPEKIRDGNKKRPSDPDYDPRTLHVPDDFLRNQTPGHRQWWEMKAKNFDCIIFFKVGKFYELYHMDAVTAVKELSLTFMRGEYAHCGFPEIAYGRFAANLVDKGYKVARVEQTETPDMMNERLKKTSRPTKFDKVVNREICQMTTKGTRIFTVVDGESREAQSQFLLAICEKETDSVRSTYGVCFIDTTIGTFHVGQFQDDRHSSRLRTMVSLYPPVQVIYERNRISKRTQQILGTTLSGAVKEALSPDTEFWTSTTTLTKLAERKYFGENGLPEILKSFVGDSDTLCLTASEESELGVRSLGAVIWLLTRCLLDYQLVSLGQFEIYRPIDCELPELLPASQEITVKNMILDAVTLKNLNILDNGCGGLQGTLIHQIDHCCTPFGKRLLRHWLCNPLTSVSSIKARQNAIKVLQESPNLMKDTSELLTKVPDLERLLSRIHAQSTKGLEDSHPENRAIMFEEKVYSKKKINEFISVLNGFQLIQDTAELMQGSGVCGESEILRDCTHFVSSEPSGNFPDLSTHLTFFKNAFDHEQAEKEGKIVPSAGVDPEYDSALDMMAEVEKDLKKYLKSQCDYFGCKVTYVGNDKKRFQLEIAEGPARKAGDGYELQGQRKGYKKFYTQETKDLLERQMAAEDLKNNAMLNLRKRIFARFSDRIEDWSRAVNCIAVLDVLMSLAKYSNSIEGDVCTPQFLESTTLKKPYVKVQNGKFPCGSGDFIPNDTEIGGDGASILLLTGPNMGGKSTLMRQLGLLTILAQMGCLVPAESMELSIVDRIFTRIGAQDDILAGDSTFYLELCETSAILAHASRHSLVLIDELGRGTSTYDGTAIASAVLHELCRMESRTIFSTHYHSLVDSFKEDPNISLVHMACMAENDDEEGSEETVTFLYKVASGGCPKSYGFNAARLAGVPKHITILGAARARELEAEVNRRNLFRLLFTSDDTLNVIRNIK